MNPSVSLSPLDRLLSLAGRALATVGSAMPADRPSPAQGVSDEGELSPPERRLSGALMRVNHVGEVCAQALYEGQALTARDPALREQFLHAAAEENDHLVWTRERLEELGDRPSLLNPVWYAGALALGALAGRAGDRISLGFMAETERQVELHLEGHLDRLPAQDARSRAIVAAMKEDEVAHADAAIRLGGVELPAPVRGLMRAAARVMTTSAHYL
jgi:ubiquinone biosynthesis monooxygenase Coq7